MVSAERKEYWSAPIPHPESMRGYEEVLPGSVDRIIAMAEREANARHANDASVIANEKLMIEATRDEVKRGQCFALIITLFGIAASLLCAYVGQPWVAGILGGGTLATVVSAMLNAKSKPQN